MQLLTSILWSLAASACFLLLSPGVSSAMVNKGSSFTDLLLGVKKFNCSLLEELGRNERGVFVVFGVANMSGVSRDDLVGVGRGVVREGVARLDGVFSF